MPYLLDTDVFIQAKNLHCGLDFCPAFWQWLVVNNAGGLVFSIEKVGDEIDAGDTSWLIGPESAAPASFSSPIPR